LHNTAPEGRSGDAAAGCRFQSPDLVYLGCHGFAAAGETAAFPAEESGFGRDFIGEPGLFQPQNLFRGCVKITLHS